MDTAVQTQCDRYGGSGIIKKAFVVLKRPGKVPEKKGAFVTEQQLNEFVRECIRCRELDDIIVCRLTWDDDLWVDDGREMIEIDDSFHRRKAPQ